MVGTSPCLRRHSSGVVGKQLDSPAFGLSPRRPWIGTAILRSAWRHLLLIALWAGLVPLVLAAAARAADGPAKIPAPSTATEAAPAPVPPPPAPSLNAATAGSSAAAEVVEIKPEIYYLRDKDNHLIPAPNFSYDDFIKYYRLKEQLERVDSAPRYNLQQLTVQGTATDERAEITVVAKLLTTDANWVRVPLRFNRCALRDAALYKGSGEQFLQFDPSGDGYVCWLRGAPRSEHELTLKLLAPLSATVGETRLDLPLPRAAASKVVIHLARDKIVAEATAAGGVLAAETTVAKEGGSDVEVLGAGGDFSLMWRDADQPASKISSALEVSGLLFVRIDGRSVNTEATLTVRSFGAEFDHFAVRLPPGAQLAGGRQSGYSVTALGANTGLAEVKLDRKTAGPIEVRLATERAYDVTKSKETLELAGFSVVEAIPHRQWGHIAVAVSGDWQLVWAERTRMQQVDELPDALKRKDVVAGFEYFGQPSKLNLSVAQRKTRIGVEPQYVYRVLRDRVDLEARLRYSVRGARLFKLEIGLGDWELDHVHPDNLVDWNALAVGEGGVVTIPLLQPASSDLELMLQAHRRIPPGGKSIEWTLPEPQVDVLGPAEITILPSDNVELNPQTDKLVGLGRSSTGPIAGGALSQNVPLFYRAEQPRARFVADLVVHPQTVTTDVATQVAVHSNEVAVDQSFTFDIRYEPLERLTLDVPRELYDAHKIKFLLAGEAVEPRPAVEQSSSERRAVQLAWKRPLIGPIKLELHFVIPHEKLATATSRTLDIPLAMPADGQISSNTAVLTCDPGIRVEQREGLWSVVESTAATSDARATMQLTSDGSATEIRLALSLDDGRSASVTFIDRAWIQSWVAKSVRQDRAAYNFTTSEEQLRLTLPAGVAASDVEVALDGKSIAPAESSAGTLAIDIPAESSRRDHLLELRYQFSSRGPHNGWLSMDEPRFETPVQIRRTYWQLALPADEHLVLAPDGLTPEYDWTWRDYGLGFGRVPLKEQRQLEQWVGLDRSARSTPPAPGAAAAPPPFELPAKTNRYLFSTSGPGGKSAVFVARRWVILFAASLSSLLVGLALVYIPSIRRPRTLIAAATVLFLATIVWPEPALLIAQAAALGFALLVLALVLQRIVGRRLRPAPPPPLSFGSASAVLERSSKRFVTRSVETPTTTASIAIELSTHEPAP